MTMRALSLRRAAGLSLVEVMVSLAIGLFLLMGLVAVFANSNRTYQDLNRSMQQIENGRFAVQTLADDLSLAGFYGRLPAMLSAPAALPDPCELSDMSKLRAATAFPVQGYDAPSSSPLTCLANANFLAGTDILVVRRVDTQVTAPSALVAAQAYLQANADANQTANPIVALGNAANFTLTDYNSTTVSPIRKLRVHIYFVSPCSIPNGGGSTCTGSADDGGKPIPTLKRLELSVSASTGQLVLQVVPLVEGIENLQIDYGVDSDNDGGPNGSYVSAPSAVADWANVMTVRVNALARNLQASSDTDTRSYDMGTAGTVTPGGNYKRHVYNATVRLMNPSARRDS